MREMEYLIAYECALERVTHLNTINKQLESKILVMQQEIDKLKIDLEQSQSKYSHVCSTCNRDNIQGS